MSLAGKRVAILVEYNYEDLEVHYPLIRFKEENCDVFTVGPKAGVKYTGKYTYPCVSDKSIDEVKAEDLDCLIVPGGWAPDYWRRDERFKQLVRQMNDMGKPIGSICHGPWLLSSARILKDRTITCFHAIRDDIEFAGAKFVDQAVVVDGNLITSRTPADLHEFCRELLVAMRARLQ